jgi:hypothetical protein
MHCLFGKKVFLNNIVTKLDDDLWHGLFAFRGGARRLGITLSQSLDVNSYKTYHACGNPARSKGAGPLKANCFIGLLPE